MLLVTGASKTFYPLIHEDPDLFGVLMVPRAGNILPTRGKWAADNGAFTGFDEKLFMEMLNRHHWAKEKCLWVACPDVVGDAEKTLRLWKEWSPLIVEMGYRPAYVLQDGVEHVPWSELEAVFIGGSTEFKLGPEAARIAHEACLRGKWVHMGRVNSSKRLRYAASIGCSSVDGTGWSKFPEAMLKAHGKMLHFCRQQRELFRKDAQVRALFRSWGLEG